MEDAGDLLDVSSKRPSVYGIVSISAAVLSFTSLEVVDVEGASGGGGDLLQLVAGHRHARGIRAVCVSAVMIVSRCSPSPMSSK